MKQIKKAFKCAFPKTIPIFAGFWFLGASYGILRKRLQLFLSDADESDDLRRLTGVYRCFHADEQFCPLADISGFTNHTGKTSVLWYLHA